MTKKISKTNVTIKHLSKDIKKLARLLEGKMKKLDKLKEKKRKEDEKEKAKNAKKKNIHA